MRKFLYSLLLVFCLLMSCAAGEDTGQLLTEQYEAIVQRLNVIEVELQILDLQQQLAELEGRSNDLEQIEASRQLLIDESAHLTEQKASLAAELAQRRYDLVLANIVADVIIPLAPQVPNLLAEDATFLCSGIIDTRAHEVEAALKKVGLSITKKREKNGWVALEAKMI